MQVLKDNEDLLNFIAKTNSYEYNVKKALEECTEFMMDAIKQDTKGSSKPSNEDVLNEYGDMVMRGFILLLMKHPHLSTTNLIHQVGYRITKKFKDFEKIIENNKFVRDRL